MFGSSLLSSTVVSSDSLSYDVTRFRVRATICIRLDSQVNMLATLLLLKFVFKHNYFKIKYTYQSICTGFNFQSFVWEFY